MTRFAATLLLITTACGGPGVRWEQLPIKVAPLTQADLEVYSIYNIYFGTEVFVADDDGVPTVFEELPKGTIGQAKVNFHGGTINSAIIRMAPFTENSVGYKHILAHELGHVLGFLEHTETGLMVETSILVSEPIEELMEGEFADWVRTTYSEYFTQGE